MRSLPRARLEEAVLPKRGLPSTCLELEPLAIIRLYSYRFRIECTFRELKQQVGAFCYRFWSKHMPKISHYQKKEEPTALEQVEDEKSRQKILEAVRATEMHMVLSCIAMGIVQSLSLCFRGEISSGEIRYQRKGVRSSYHGLSAEIFFPSFGETAGIAHNADNSGTTG